FAPRNDAGELLSPAIAQARRNAVDGDLDATQDLLVRILRAVFLQQLDLNVIERIEIGKAVADRTLQQRVALQQPLLPHDIEQRPDASVPFAADATKDVFAQAHIRHQFG